MSAFKYTPDRQIQVHREGAVRQMCAPFKSHKDGLPEWVKNSSDAYSIAERAPQNRVIVVFAKDSKQPQEKSIACLDFVGMSVERLEESFSNWGDPEAAAGSDPDARVQGGHGNGGKCYMTQMFNDRAELITVRAHRRCHYGVPGGSVRFGYVPDPDAGRDAAVADLPTALDDALSSLGLTLGDLPTEAQEALEVADGFTLVAGFEPKLFEDTIAIDQLLSTLEDHPQMRASLELCRIYLVANGAPAKGGNPVQLPEIAPMEDEEPREIDIPTKLKHPESGGWISTTEDESLPRGKLVLSTSEKNLVLARRRHRHVVTFNTESGYIGFVPVRELSITSSYRDKIYGECFLEAAEAYKKNERQRLATSPLTEALEHFIAHKIQALASEFEERDRRKYKRAVKDGVAAINEALDEWKNKYLSKNFSGWGPGGVDSPPPPPLPLGTPAAITVTMSHTKAGVGVALRPNVKFYDASGKRIRVESYDWVSEDTNVAWVSKEQNILWTFEAGDTRVYVEAGDVASNKVALQVVDIQQITLSPQEVEVQVGGRTSIGAECTLREGTTATDVTLIWTEDHGNVARVNSIGTVFGAGVGETNVTAGDDRCFAENSVRIKVLERTRSGTDKDKKGAGGFPLILVSGGFQQDPETGEDVHFAEDEPPVTQRAIDTERNIWWINSASPLARLYLDDETGHGFESMAWRLYHIERLADVLVSIMMANRLEEDMDIDQWSYERGSLAAKLQKHISTDLRAFISEGTLPTGEGDSDA